MFVAAPQFSGGAPWTSILSRQNHSTPAVMPKAPW